MEETYMKFAKSRGGSGGAGLTDILENFGAYQIWICTTSEWSKFYQATMEMCGLNDDTNNASSAKHREKPKLWMLCKGFLIHLRWMIETTCTYSHLFVHERLQKVDYLAMKRKTSLTKCTS